MLTVLLLAFIASVVRASVYVGGSQIIGQEFGPAKVEFFGGIPYAKAPIGKLRFQPPVLVRTPPTKTLSAQTFGKACLQVTKFPDTVSEDCLTLNIFRPIGTTEHEKLPVMVWIHGGGFHTGSSSLYNGTTFVAQSISRGTPIIFASFNYRLGPLGFPQGVEAGKRKALNLGLKDQLAALEWIQLNIAKFGGDKRKVTLIGQSAGATSISIHLRKTKIRSLARAAILESTPIGPVYGPDRNGGSWRRFVEATSACAAQAKSGNTIDCMRTAEPQSIFTALTAAEDVSSHSYHPVIDGPHGFIVDRPSKVNLNAAGLPLLIGTNLDEGTLFITQKTNSTEQIEDLFRIATSPSLVSPGRQAEVIAQILKLYPDNPALGSPFGTGNDTFGLNSQYKRLCAIFGDFYIQSPTRSIQQHSCKAGINIFGYLFTDPHGVAIPGLARTRAAPGSVGVPHSAEISFLFDTFVNRTEDALNLSQNMRDYWISFATSLDPNDKFGNTARPHWRPFTHEKQEIIELNGLRTKMMTGDFRKDRIQIFQNNSNTLHR